MTEAILLFREHLNISWSTIEKISSKQHPYWIDNWLQASYELIVEAYCNNVSDCGLCLDYYGNGAEDYDDSLPPSLRKSPKRITYANLEATHTIICKPKVTGALNNFITNEELLFPKQGLVFGRLLGKKAKALGICPNFDVVELADSLAPEYSYFDIDELEFWLVPLSSDMRK